jgi:hypothetical protein
MKNRRLPKSCVRRLNRNRQGDIREWRFCDCTLSGFLAFRVESTFNLKSEQWELRGRMEQVKQVKALQYIRKLRGGSQPILVRANDGHVYVVKFRNNLQGPNLPFNEAMGTELFRVAGFNVPKWRLVEVSDDFIDRNPSCWMETECGWRRPASGLCFGSEFLSLRSNSIFEILPEQRFSRIRNRRDFLKAWVFDVLSEHADNRQAVFLERYHSLDAYFIDHGHLFGGANGTVTPKLLVSRFLDPRIYCEPDRNDADVIERMVRHLDLTALAKVSRNLPDEWRTPAALARYDRFVDRLSDPLLLRMTVRFILDSVEPARKDYGGCAQSSRIRHRRQDLYAQILQA